MLALNRWVGAISKEDIKDSKGDTGNGFIELLDNSSGEYDFLPDRGKWLSMEVYNYDPEKHGIDSEAFEEHSGYIYGPPTKEMWKNIWRVARVVSRDGRVTYNNAGIQDTFILPGYLIFSYANKQTKDVQAAEVSFLEFPEFSSSEGQITREINLLDYTWHPNDGGPQITVAPNSKGAMIAAVELNNEPVFETIHPGQLRTFAAVLIAAAAELERPMEVA